MNILRKKFRYIDIFIKYTVVLLKSNLQYRLNAVFLSLGIFIREMVNVVIVYLMFKKIDEINGWNFYEVIFLYSLLYVSYGLLIGIFAGVRDFSRLVQRGELDRYLVRPLPILFQVVTSGADYFTSIANMVAGIGLLTFSISHIEIVWTFINVVYLIITIISGVMIQLALFILIDSLTIWAVKADGIRTILFFNIKRFAGYPISIFPSLLKIILMYIIPFAFVNYFPAQFFLNKGDMSAFPSYLPLLSPILGLGSIIITLLLWKVSIRKYNSTGN